MKCTIVLCSTKESSFSKSILDSVGKELDKKLKAYELIDLYDDNFNPVMTAEGERCYCEGKPSDELVSKYQKILKDSDEIVFIFPIWWNNVPAMLKGFFDKVFIKEFAFKEENRRPQGLLTNIKKGLLITTSETDTEYIKNDLGNPIENTIIKATLNVAGISNVNWINKNMADEDKKEFLCDLIKYI